MTRKQKQPTHPGTPVAQFRHLRFKSEGEVKLWLSKTAEEIIHLQDLGQDLLMIWIHESGEILYTNAQGSIWCGRFIDRTRLHNDSEIHMSEIGYAVNFDEMDFIPDNIEAAPKRKHATGQVMLSGTAVTRAIALDGQPLSPERSIKIRNHSPDGFNWGYGGSGPAQLALAILLELTDERAARANYQKFKFDVIAGLPGGADFKKMIDIMPYL